MALHSIEAIIEDIRQGKMVIMVDDEDRENEGDLVMAAEKVTPFHINFMARFARGLICLPLTKEKCAQLKLPLMVMENHSAFRTNFTTSIEAAQGVTTGISAQDRAHTILSAAQPNAQPKDIVQPGHVFPIMSQPGGVLVRAGHTEASTDLARLAGLTPAGVLCEILNEDGSMARRPQLEVFAKQHQLKMGTIADLIRYRLRHEPTVKEVKRTLIETRFGQFECVAFVDEVTQQQHMAFLYGSPRKDEGAWVRVHVHDILEVALCTRGRWPLEAAFSFVAQSQAAGAVLLLEQPILSEAGLCEKMQKLSVVGTPKEKKEQAMKEERLIGIGSQILSALGFGKIAVLGEKKQYCGLSGFGLEVVQYLSFEQANGKRV